MKRRFNIKKRTGNRIIIFLLLMTGLIVVSLFAYSSLFPKMQEDYDKNYKNIDITFFDHSINKENPSGKISIDGKVVYQIDSISESLFQNTEINLKKGKHTVEISTIDDKFKLIDTIEVTNYPITYKFLIQYNYNPPIKEYREIVIKHFYQKSLKGKNYNTAQKSELLKRVSEKINKEFENDINYKPSERNFSFSFRDISYYPIR